MRLPVTTSDRPTSQRLPPATRPLLHRHLSRRTFLRGSAGAAGLALGSGLIRQLPASAAPPGTGEPSPIPGGIQPVPGGPVFHVFLPAEGSEPSTIIDFNGSVGVSVTQGTWSATGTPTGGVSSGVWEADMRFMKGLFVGTDGRRRQGAFGFVWIDLFPVSVGTDQIHDFNPGIAASGLFWTAALPFDGVKVGGLSGAASMRATDLDLDDYFTIENALFGGGPEEVSATASFDVEWSGATGGGSASDATNDFTLEWVMTGSTLAWTVESGDATYTSTGVTATPFSIVGKERNGVFF